MRSFTSAGQPGRCRQCWIRETHCICAHLPQLQTRTNIVIVRHERESWKSTGTARIAALALPQLRILEFGEDAQPARSALSDVLMAGAHLLFPTEQSAPWTDNSIQQLVLLDGTWRQARRMFSKLPALSTLPRLALPPQNTAVLRLRESHFEGGRSTLESIATAVSLLEGAAAAAPLFELHSRYVEQVFRARGVWEQKSTGPRSSTTAQ